MILLVSMILFPFQSVSEYIGNTFVVSTGHAMLNMKNVIFFGVLNVFLDVLFVALFGASGVLYARIISISVGTVFLIFLYYKALNAEVATFQRKSL
jgi:O-antigen/teichoic acid export membrane protein